MCLLATIASAAGSINAQTLNSTVDWDIQSTASGTAPYTVKSPLTATGSAWDSHLDTTWFSRTLENTYVVAFQLPTLAAGQQFGTASAIIQMYNNAPSGGGPGVPEEVDLYGLNRADASPNAVRSDFYLGATPDPTATLLQVGFIPAVQINATPTPFTSSDISSWLNAEYAGGLNAGDYVYLRLSAEVAPSQMDVLTAESGNTPIINYTIETVPEPTTIAMVSGGLGLLVVLRRRKS